MIRAAFGRQVAQQLCELWRLDPDRVTSIVIELEPDDIVRVTVTQLVDEDDDVAEVFRPYELRPLEEKP